MDKARYNLGIDVGGTFTDLLLADSETGAFEVAKVSTTPADQSQGVLAGIERLGVAVAEIASITHGTTAGTNAILERKGARVGMITTRGFRDVIELGRRTRPFAYGMIGSYEALIPRELRLEVTERVSAEGDVITALDEDDLLAAIDRLARQNLDALVIHFLHSYANPTHERRALEIARELWPTPYVVAGSAILPEFREFERGVTASLNAYIQPLVSRYIERLNRQLRDDGLGHDLLVMQGNGGMMAASVVVDHAIHTVMSGPAAGATAAARTASAAGFPNIITCDMGGTSFDVALIRDSQPILTTERELGYGLPVRVPMVDIQTIGAGGGSIARISAAGILEVGPESAGAEPGPICYGRGGTEPTVTDANLLLGRIDTAALAGDLSPASVNTVREAISEKIGGPLGLDAIDAAAAIISVTNNQLAGAIRMVSIEKGHDPRDFALFPFGGAGPLHAVALARELGIPQLLIPRFPGITSALGCVLADVRHDYVQSINLPLEDANPKEIEAILTEQIKSGQDLIASEGVGVGRIDVSHEADLLYRGQSHILRIPISGPGFDRAAVLDSFTSAYLERFDIELSEMRPILSAVRTTVIGRRPSLDIRHRGQDAAKSNPRQPTHRAVYFDGRWTETPVFSREDLPDGWTVTGPAIIEQLDTTIIIEPAAMATVDRLGNLIVETGMEDGADGGI